AEGPTVSSANATGVPRSSSSRRATGRREYRGSGSPFGRPRWATTTTFAPASASRRIVGTEARTRPSSVIRSPSSGTLRSLRTRTRLPRRSPRSSMRFTATSEGLADLDGQVDQAAGVAPLVVVPADDLHLVADDPGHARVEDAGVRVGLDVLGDDRVLGVLEDALEGALGRGLHRSEERRAGKKCRVTS